MRPIVDRLPWPNVRGLRGLDVGTADGFLAFELERRGAREVAATDLSEHERWDWPLRALPPAAGTRAEGARGQRRAAAAGRQRRRATLRGARPARRVSAQRFAGRSVLVTGAQGFIGSWLAERLLDDGARVVVPRRDVEPDSRFRTDGIDARCVIAQGDVTDYESMLRILNEHGVSAVFHLAAQTIVGTANRSPLSTFETNVRGTYVLLEACRAVGGVGAPIGEIVVASSDKAYGEHEQLPYREDFPLLPRYPYDVSKACTDMIARSYAVTYDLPVAVTRLANVYGGGDLNWSRIVPDTARALAAGDAPIIRSDGSPVRDYLYVEDAVAAYLAVAASLEDAELYGRAWNAGTGTPASVREIVDRLTAVSGVCAEPDVQGTGTPHAEIDRQYLDSTAIREQLGWFPRYSLDEGLAATWAWYEQRLSDRE